MLLRWILGIEIETREPERRVEYAFMLDGFDDGGVTNIL